MATVSSTIQLFNGMTPALQNITNALNITISHFEQMQRLSGNSIDTASLRAARNEIRNAEANIRDLERTLRDTGQEGQNANRNIRDLGGNAGHSNQIMLQMIRAMERLNTTILHSSETMERLDDTTNRVRQDIQRLGDNGRRIPPEIDRAANSQGLLNRLMSQGVNTSNNFLGVLKNIAGVYLSFRGIDIVGGLADKITSITARLNLMNDGLRTTQELSNSIMRSSFDAGSSYITTAESIAKMGLNASSAFQNNDELIAFMDQINKTFAIGGATAEEQNNAMIQLTQSMAAGALRGEELNSILDSGPGIARNIEKYMGWAEGSIKKYAEDGKVTAQVVKNAMLSMAEETNSKFNSIPATIGQTFSRIKTLALKSFTPVLQGINGLINNEHANKILYYWGATFQYIADRCTVTIEKLKAIVNSDKFVSFSQDIITAFSAAGAAITWVFDTIVGAFSYVVENWDSVKPVLLGMVTALGVVTAAQWALNIAMSLNPVTIIIGLITALIVLFYKVVDRINEVKNTSISATAIIAGVFAGLYAIVRNKLTLIWNVVATTVNFIVNFFQNGTAAIKVYFLEMAETILGVIQGIVGAIADLSEKMNMPITNGLKKFENTVEKWKNANANKAQEIKNKAGLKDLLPKLDYINMQETVTNTVFKVTGFENGIKGFMESFDPFDGVNSVNDMLGEMLKNIQNMSKDTSEIADELQRDKEDLEFLRTVANIKYGDKYVMPQVNVEMTNNNTIQSEMDLDGFFDKKIEEIGNLINISAEGVHI